MLHNNKSILCSLGLFVAIIVLSSCRDGFGCPGSLEIVLKNQTTLLLSTYVADGTNSGFSYPDTNLTNKAVNSFCLTEHIKETFSIYIQSAYSYGYLVIGTSNKVLSIYVFSQDEVQEIGWESIFKNNQFLVRYDLTKKDLNKLKGKLCFPPDEKMKEVRMYPPYEEVIKRY